MATTMRITERSHETLRRLSDEAKLSMQEIADRAIEEYRRRQILEQTNAAYAGLRLDPEAWQQELEERADWEDTLADGLEEA